MMNAVPTVTQQQIATFIEAAAVGQDVQACLINEDFTLLPHGIWLWDGTAGEHHLTTDEDLALLMPDELARSAWVGRLVKVVLDYEVIAEFCDSLTEDQDIEFRKAA